MKQKKQGENTYTRGLIGIAIGLLVLIVIFAIAGSQKGQGLKEKPTSPTSTNSQSSYHQPGDQVRLGSFTFTVAGSPKTTRCIGGCEYGKQASEDATFYLVKVRIKNIANETKSLSILQDWRVISTAHNLEFKVSQLADIYLDQQDQLDPNDVPPGISRTGYIIFELPEKVACDQLLFKVKAGLSGETTFNLPQTC